MWKNLLDFFFPRHSLTGMEGEWVTLEEMRQLVSHTIILGQNDLQRLGLSSLDFVVAATDYRRSPLLRQAIVSFKYRRIRELDQALGEVLAEASQSLPCEVPPVLCPVPLHWMRRFSRGFNQAERLSEHVSWVRGWTHRSLLVRVRFTGSQVGRDREERQSALKGCFRLVHVDELPPLVILVDDVMTTGTTLQTCASILRQHGVLRVFGLVLARD